MIQTRFFQRDNGEVIIVTPESPITGIIHAVTTRHHKTEQVVTEHWTLRGEDSPKIDGLPELVLVNKARLQFLQSEAAILNDINVRGAIPAQAVVNINRVLTEILGS